MREIKFRALLDRTKYDSSYKHWFYSDEMGLDNFFSMVIKNKLKPDQYIDKRDKNGKEIYEGDIVRKVAQSTNQIWLTEVKWEGCGFVFFLDEDYDPSRFCLLEVIGNIYENPVVLG